MRNIQACIDKVPTDIDFYNRVIETISCTDADYIPKVDGAGEVFFQNGIYYQLMHNGVKIHKGSYHGDWMCEIIKQLKGHHEPQEEKAFYEVVKSLSPKSTMIELGSNWSYYSLWFNKAIEHANNYMIEPNPIKLATGKRNFELNNAKGKFTNAFIGDKPLDNAQFVDWDNTTINLPQVSIDSFIHEHNIHYVDVLHSDIQGAEYMMLLGALQSIKKNLIGYIFVSTHDMQHNKCLDLLINNDYDILCQHKIEESFSVDGLIVAKSRKIGGTKDISISAKSL